MHITVFIPSFMALHAIHANTYSTHRHAHIHARIHTDTTLVVSETKRGLSWYGCYANGVWLWVLFPLTKKMPSDSNRDHSDWWKWCGPVWKCTGQHCSESTTPICAVVLKWPKVCLWAHWKRMCVYSLGTRQRCLYLIGFQFLSLKAHVQCSHSEPAAGFRGGPHVRVSTGTTTREAACRLACGRLQATALGLNFRMAFIGWLGERERTWPHQGWNIAKSDRILWAGVCVVWAAAWRIARDIAVLIPDEKLPLDHVPYFT